jgi:hypothetical protein
VQDETDPLEKVKLDDSRVEARKNKIRAEGKLELAERKEKRETKTTEQRLKVCEIRKKSINNKIATYNKVAQNKLDRFNVIFERVKTFKTDKALEVDNYDALLTAATEKQTAAAESVAALKEITADFDCTATDPAATIASIKAAAIDARTALKDYRTSIKNIVVAIAQVNKTDATNNDDPATTTPETTTEAN